MGFAMNATQEAKTGNPFQAEIEETREVTQKNGKLSIRLSTGAFWRDAEGRERTDSYTLCGQNVGISEIYDPVSKLEFSFDLQSRKVLLKETIHDASGLRSFRARTIGSGQAVAVPNGQPNSEPDLGLKDIEGVTCSGYSLSRPPWKLEWWYSKELDEVILIKLTKESEQIVWRLFKISRTNPPSDLFRPSLST